MLKEGKKYVNADRNGEASGFIRNFSFAVSELLPKDKQTEFDALVGIKYKTQITCTTNQHIHEVDPVEPYLYLQVPENRILDLEEAVYRELKRRESVVEVAVECQKSSCQGEKAQKRSKVSQLPKVLNLVFDREEKKQHETKPMVDNKMTVQGKTYQLSSIIHHNGDSSLASGNFYCDLDQSSWLWRCNQEDQRGPREVENRDIGDTYKLGHIYTFVEQQHDNEEPEIR